MADKENVLVEGECLADSPVTAKKKGGIVSNLLSVLSPSTSLSNAKSKSRSSKKKKIKIVKSFSDETYDDDEDDELDIAKSTTPTKKLVKPGWSRTPPPPQGNSASAVAELVGSAVKAAQPTITISDIAKEMFGSAATRVQERRDMLQRRKPAKKYGRFDYKKKIEFQESEVKRLAAGLKAHYTSVEGFIERCIEHETAHLQSAGNAEKIVKAAAQAERALKTKTKS